MTSRQRRKVYKAAKAANRSTPNRIIRRGDFYRNCAAEAYDVESAGAWRLSMLQQRQCRPDGTANDDREAVERSDRIAHYCAD